MQPGDRIDARFELERLAGAGGSGAVWRARDLARDGAPVALKLVALADARAAERFAREAVLLATVRHPHVVAHLAHGTTHRRYGYLAMPWLKGEDLAQRLARGAPLALDATTQLLARAADALGAVHAAGVIHRDIKPANLFLPGSRLDAVTLLDFGIARGDPAAHDALTGSQTILGTPGYMSPEQTRGGRAVDPRADVFALGAVAFECLTGRRAFPGRARVPVLMGVLFDEVPDVRTLRPDAPAGLAALVARMLAKDPDARPADGAALAAALVHAAAPDPTAAQHDEARNAGVPVERLVLVARLDAAARATAATRAPTRGAEASTRGDAQTWRAQTAVAAHGGQVHRLADGSLLVTVAPTHEPAASDAALARCALALGPVLPGATLALGAALAQPGERQPLSASLVSLLELADGAAPGTVRVDDVAAARLAGRFAFARDAVGARRLAAERPA